MFKDRCCGRPEMPQAKETYQMDGANQEYPEAFMGSQAGMNMGYGYGMNMNMGMGMGMGCQMPPVYECPQERVCHKQFVYEVPHIIPINTRVINHHIYRHSYSPCYTCCEENVVSNVYDGCSNNF